MTDKEKARAYDEALDRCKEWASGTCGQSVNNSPKDVAEFIFPQLRESEDERIIEEIKFAVMQMPSSRQDTKNRCLAYLEKQKPMYNLEIPAGDIASAEEDGPFDEDEFLENELSAFLQNYDKEYDDDAAVSDVAKHFYEIGKKVKPKQAEWRPQPESLEALMYAIEGEWDKIKPTSYLSRRLEDLYEGLVNTFNVDETLLAKLPKVASHAYTAEDIEELKTLKAKIEASMDKESVAHENDFTSKPAESGSSNNESEYDRGYRDGKAFQLKQVEQYSIGRTFMGLIPCWVNAPSTLQPAHKYHGRNAVIMHENNGGFRCCFIDDEKATTVHLPENTGFVEGWIKKPEEWSEEDEKMRLTCIDIMEHFPRPCGEVIGPWKDCIKWLKSLRPQPKQEWNEKDKKMHWIIQLALTKHPITDKQEKDAFDWLNSLRPNQKSEWSQEDEDTYNRVYCLFRDAIDEWYETIFTGCYPKITRDKVLAMLKALRPQPRVKTNDYITPHKKFFKWIYNRLIDVHNENPNVDYMQSFRKRIDNLQFDEPHWKPNEEQMKALHAASSVSSLGEYVQRHLFSLYNDLKKLV